MWNKYAGTGTIDGLRIDGTATCHKSHISVGRWSLLTNTNNFNRNFAKMPMILNWKVSIEKNKTNEPKSI